MKPRMLAAALALTLSALPALAAEQWWTYRSGQEEGPSITDVDLALKKEAPLPGYTHLITTTVSYAKTRDADGLPSKADADRDNALATDLMHAISARTPAKLAGVFWYKREHIMFIYVKKEDGIDKLVKDFYAAKCPRCESSVMVKPDVEWKQYFDFLYPNAATQKFYAADWARVQGLPPPAAVKPAAASAPAAAAKH